MHSFHRDTGNLMCEQLSNQANVSCIQNTQQKVTRTMDAERVHVSVPNPLRILDLSHLMVS